MKIKKNNRKNTLEFTMLILVFFVMIFILFSKYVFANAEHCGAVLDRNGLESPLSNRAIVSTNIGWLPGGFWIFSGNAKGTCGNSTSVAVSLARNTNIHNIWFWKLMRPLSWHFTNASVICPQYPHLRGCPTPPDLCTNISGRQTTMPAGFKSTGGGICTEIDRCVNIVGVQETIPTGFRDVGGRVCQLDRSQFSVLCSPNNNPVQKNQNVIFTASPLNQSSGQINYSWRNVSTDSVLETATSSDSSRYTASSSSEGVFQVKIIATDSSGRNAERICGVTISNATTSTSTINIVTPTSTPPVIPSINLTLRGSGLTNNTCPIEWTSQNIIECYLANTRTGANEQVPTNGTKNINPGTYLLRCISSSQSADLVESQTVTCRLNPTVIEF